MAKSLQDQLMNSGLIDEKKAKKIKKQQRTEKKQTQKGHKKPNETKAAAKQSLAEKSARDREENKERQDIFEQKAIVAQIKQLIDINKVSRDRGDETYQFADGTKIKKIIVPNAVISPLASGLLGITKLNDRYELVPRVIAEKITQRDPTVVIVLNKKDKSVPEEDDPYADFQIPDDLMW